jgi:hypothetical protein
VREEAGCAGRGGGRAPAPQEARSDGVKMRQDAPVCRTLIDNADIISNLSSAAAYRKRRVRCTRNPCTLLGPRAAASRPHTPTARIRAHSHCTHQSALPLHASEPIGGDSPSSTPRPAPWAPPPPSRPPPSSPPPSPPPLSGARTPSWTASSRPPPRWPPPLAPWWFAAAGGSWAWRWRGSFASAPTAPSKSTSPARSSRWSAGSATRRGPPPGRWTTRAWPTPCSWTTTRRPCSRLGCGRARGRRPRCAAPWRCVCCRRRRRRRRRRPARAQAAAQVAWCWR